jgi:phosphoglycolate phosphatase
MYKYNTVLFDVDGTLVQSGEGIITALKYALDKAQMPCGDEAWCRDFIGPPLEDILTEKFDINDEKSREIYTYYREFYDDKGVYMCSRYPGVEDMLMRLRSAGICICTATTKPEEMAHKILEHVDLTKYIDVIVGARYAENIFRKTDVLKCVLATVNPDKNATIMVGDTKYDILGAKDVALPVIAVTYGYGRLDELEAAAPDVFVDTPQQIADYILAQRR